MAAAPHLVTPRLALRPFTPRDIDRLDRLNSDPRVMQYLGGPAPRADTERMLGERILAYYERNPGLGVWATVERASGECIGFHLLNHIQGESFIQVGYRLFPEFWGRGFASEMTAALLAYGFAGLQLPRIVAIADLRNAASQRVLIKCGLRRAGERAFAHPAYAKFGALAWFERDAHAWAAEHAEEAAAATRGT